MDTAADLHRQGEWGKLVGQVGGKLGSVKVDRVRRWIGSHLFSFERWIVGSQLSSFENEDSGMPRARDAGAVSYARRGIGLTHHRSPGRRFRHPSDSSTELRGDVAWDIRYEVELRRNTSKPSFEVGEKIGDEKIGDRLRIEYELRGTGARSLIQQRIRPFSFSCFSTPTSTPRPYTLT